MNNGSNTVSNDAITTAQVNKRRGRGTHLIVRVVAVLVLIFLLLTAVAITAGYLYVGVKQPAQSVRIVSAVCGKGDIDTYNALVFPLNEDDQKKLDGIVKSINSNKEAVNDPTCQSILFQAAYQKYDVPAMEAAYKNVQASYDKGIYADSNLAVGIPPAGMSSAIHEVKAH